MSNTRLKFMTFFLVIMTSISEPYVRCQNMKMEQQQTQREAFSWLVAVKWAESIQDLKNCRTAAPSSSKARELCCKLRKEVKLMKVISPPTRSR